MTWDLTPDYVKRPLGPRNGKDGKYDGFGLCIYCKGQSTSLRREHIYPKGLGGVLEIRDASCRECEQETHAFEGRAMQALLLPRLIEGFKTSQPQTIPLQRIQNGSWVDVQVEHSGHYARANMPVFLPAKAFLGTSPNVLSRPLLSNVTATLDDELLPPLTPVSNQPALAGEGATAELIDPDSMSFARMIAKIAYCNAIVRIGMDAFNSLIPDFVRYPQPTLLGAKFLNFGADYFVGTDYPILQEPDSSRSRIDVGSWIFGSRVFIFGRVRLFADRGAPIYHVCLGDPTGAGWLEFPSSPSRCNTQ